MPDQWPSQFHRWRDSCVVPPSRASRFGLGSSKINRRRSHWWVCVRTTQSRYVVPSRFSVKFLSFAWSHYLVLVHACLWLEFIVKYSQNGSFENGLFQSILNGANHRRLGVGFRVATVVFSIILSGPIIEQNVFIDSRNSRSKWAASKNQLRNSTISHSNCWFNEHTDERSRSRIISKVAR